MQAISSSGFPTALRRAGVAAALVLAAVLAGCGDEAAGPGKGDAETPEAIAGQIRPVLAPLETLLTAPAADNGNFTLVDAEWRRGLAVQMRQARKTYGGTENGEAALARIADELEALIRRARDEDRWGLALCAIEIHEELRPGMHLMRLLRERAMLHAMRPHVVVKGFFDDNDKNDLYVFFKVTLRAGYQPWPEAASDEVAPAGAGAAADAGGEGEATVETEAREEEVAAPRAAKPLERDEVHMVQVRLKEEFYGLRLVDVVGNKRGVVLEYLADPGHFFQVLMPPREFGSRRRVVSGTN